MVCTFTSSASLLQNIIEAFSGCWSCKRSREQSPWVHCYLSRRGYIKKERNQAKSHSQLHRLFINKQGQIKVLQSRQKGKHNLSFLSIMDMVSLSVCNWPWKNCYRYYHHCGTKLINHLWPKNEPHQWHILSNPSMPAECYGMNITWTVSHCELHTWPYAI